MREQRKRPGGRLISYRFAVAVIAVLFVASAVGWIATELVPSDFPDRVEAYQRAWGGTAVRLVTLFRLYDPFHSFWYGFVLAFFLVVLIACVATRWRQLALKSWRADMPSGAEELRGRAPSFDVPWRAGKENLRSSFSDVAAVLAGKGYRLEFREQAGEIRFAAYAGRWRSPGTMLFHIGILAITIGGVVGSFAGWREMVFVREGGSVPFPREGTLSLRVDDFAIIQTERMEIKDYVSTVSILDARGSVVVSGKVEVNHPLKVRGRRVFQSEFRIDENEFSSARIAYVTRDGTRNGSIDVTPGVPASVSDSAITLTALRYFPDFRMSQSGPYSASGFPSNPALEVEVVSHGGVERGWLFLNHPDFNKRFNAPVDFVLSRCEPLFYTGLEVTSNPGAPLLFIGFALATVGLMLMYLCNPRILKGIATSESIVMAGVESRWKASFEKEFSEVREALRRNTGQRG